MELEIAYHGVSADDVERAIRGCLDLTGERDSLTQVEFRRFRTPDPTILVAIVGGASAAIASTLTGLLQLVRERRVGRVILQGNDGSRIDVPSDMPLEKIDELIERVRKMPSARIHIDCTPGE